MKAVCNKFLYYLRYKHQVCNVRFLSADNSTCSKYTVQYDRIHKRKDSKFVECYENANTSCYDSTYYIENGLRKVYPYYYRFATSCKGRWINRKLIDVYTSEFAFYPAEEIEKRVVNGIISINGKTTDLNYCLKNADYITSVTHRHELPVLALSIDILYEDNDLLVVNKPPSIPVHPVGLYRHNTMLYILTNEYEYKNLHVVHRLDRLTSGVLIFSKNRKKSQLMHEQMNLRNILKEYICRVEGNFPDGTIICNKPIKRFKSKVGFSVVNSDGKLSMTEFRKLSYNGKSSVVLCKPYTGRTHQIRVHLQYLGYPIVNDPIYNSPAFGPNRGKGGVLEKPVEQIFSDLLKDHSTRWCIKCGFDNVEDSYMNNCMCNINCNLNEQLIIEKYKKNPDKIHYDDNCFFCTNTAYKDPVQTDFTLFLHAYKYKGDDWEFKTEMPYWASEEWTER